MPDYKSMYYHLAGRMATAVDFLETTTQILGATVKSLKAIEEIYISLVEMKEKLKLAQQVTEEMFISSTDDDIDTE